MLDDWSHEEAADPLHADRRNFYKVEKWSGHCQHIEVLFAGNNLDKAKRLFEQLIAKRSRSRLRSGGELGSLGEWPLTR
jgi:hypothetical protein